MLLKYDYKEVSVKRVVNVLHGTRYDGVAVGFFSVVATRFHWIWMWSFLSHLWLAAIHVLEPLCSQPSPCVCNVEQVPVFLHNMHTEYCNGLQEKSELTLIGFILQLILGIWTTNDNKCTSDNHLEMLISFTFFGFQNASVCQVYISTHFNCLCGKILLITFQSHL